MTAFQQAAVPVRMPSTDVISTTTPPVVATTSPHRDNASLILPIRISHGDKRDEQIIEVATTLCPFFENKKDCVVQPLLGGLSNELFVVSNSIDTVLVRIHPSSDHSIVDREVENRIMAWLSHEKIAPAFYGRFINGRVEEFYNGFKPLNCHEMPKYAREVASLMGKMHKLTVPDGVLSPQANKHGEVWNRMETWLQPASHTNSQSHKQEPLLDLDKLRYEYAWLKQELTTDSFDWLKNGQEPCDVGSKAIQFCREVVFTHMDCQSLNILTNSKGQVRLIDFEYAGLNPRAVDIANTFCEYCDMNNLKANYEKEFPSENQQDDFLRAYIVTAQPDLAKWLDKHNQWELFLEAMRQEIGKHTLVSHLEWTVWSIAQTSMSAVDFDYIAYAKQRMEGYHYFRSKFWSDQDRN